jgi:hypothetical protein
MNTLDSLFAFLFKIAKLAQLPAQFTYPFIRTLALFLRNPEQLFTRFKLLAQRMQRAAGLSEINFNFAKRSCLILRSGVKGVAFREQPPAFFVL